MILASHGIIASQIQSFVGLLDSYPNAAAAYSVRKLRAAYTGSAIRVRRTDLAESDIGFTSTGELDTTTLLAFTGTGALNNGFITTWYDQSGNGRNATQTTALNQPQIVSSGSVILDNSKPAIFWNGGQRLSLASDSMTNGVGYFSSFSVSKLNDNTSSTQRFLSLISTGTSSSASRILFGKNGSNLIIAGGRRLDTDSFSGATSSITYTLNRVLNSNILNYISSKLDIYINSSSVASSTTFHSGGSVSASNAQTQQIGADGAGGQNWLGNIQEMVFYTSDQSSNRTGIETNINSYYGIY
jgi:hypothetical protein